jgi:membrane protease YdiL (CAAX protease family)
MNELLQSTLLKIAAPVFAIVVVLGISRLRGISWRDDLGLRKPKLSTALGWLGLWIVWMAAGEVVIRFFGMEQPEAWPEYPPLIVALRIAAIGILGPIAEEIVMRGALLHRLRKTRVGALGAIMIVAVVWAALHYRYEPGLVALIAADGIVLGLARVYGRSLWLPILMHVLANLLSIYQSLSG